MEKSLGQRVKSFQNDNEGEFTSGEFESYLKKEGIKHQMKLQKDATGH